MPAEVPIAPNRAKTIVMAILMSLAFSVGLVVATERIRPTVHSVDALRAITTVPVLLSIPAIVTGRDIARQHRQARLATAGLVLAALLLIGVAYLIADGNEYLVSLMLRGRA
jgi:drug/metabolite transporter (DMT)-like permease